MADFYAPQFNPPPDILGQYVRGQMAPLEVQQAQQAVTQGGLNIDQMRLALQTRQAMLGAAQRFSQSFDGAPGGTPGAPAGTGAAGAQSPPMGDGGRQDGPQGSVSQPGYDASNPLGALLDPRRLAAGAQFGSLGAMLRGEDPNKPIADAQALLTSARTDALARGKIAAEKPSADNPMPMFKSYAQMSPEDAGASLAKNPQLLAQWPALAAKYGVDPWDKSKIPMVAAMEYNQRGAPYGLSVDVPHYLKNVNLGQGEIGQIDPTTGKKVGDLVERQTPSFSLVDRWDPATGQNTKVPVQTGGYGMSGVNPTGGISKVGATGAYPASTASLGFNSGFKPPSDPELKAAMFGSEMKSGLATLQQLEAKGFRLTPVQRTAFINAATSEEPGALKQLMSQTYLAKMSPDAQTYMAALMPMLQAAGHDQSGARLSTSQVRQNLESAIPIGNAQAPMDQVNKNRAGFYTGLLGQAGSALQLPQYRDLKADLQGAQAPKTAPPAALEHLKAHPELSAAFRAKYGYLP